MLIKEESPAAAERAGGEQDMPPDPSLEHLRQILLRDQSKKMERLEGDLNHLEHQIYDEGSLVKMIAPVLGNAIRLKIREARDEMIEALYPIIGKVVQRAVTESVRDLARSLDAQVKSSFDLRLTWWRLRARLSGASEAQIRLRELLPFAVTDILLIHRETGLLLFHLPSEISKTSDTDLLSGMLTAIRDFAQDTLGGDEHTGLGEITYDDQSILIEAAEHSYLAVIINGIAPPGFRAEMRDRIIEIEHSYAEELHRYTGDAEPLVSVKQNLDSLMGTSSSRQLSTGQKRFLVGMLGLFIVGLAACGLFANWIAQIARQTPVPQIIYVQPPATFTSMPSPTASFTPTPTPLPTVTQTFTMLPPTPFIALILGDVWLHTEPSAASARSGDVLTMGQQVELLALDHEWARVRQFTDGQNEILGWMPVRWLGVTTSIPAQLITPSATP